MTRRRLRLAANQRRLRLEAARLYFITPAEIAGTSLEAVLPAIIDAGVDVVQLREKTADVSALLKSGGSIRRITRAAGVLFILNDRPDIALALGADGVHLGQDDLPVGWARRIIGDAGLIGLSTHTQSQVIDAQDSGADYIGVGPVYSTPTKEGRDPVSNDLVRFAAEHSQLPFFAIGGVNELNVYEVLAAGARKIAVVRAIAQATDPAEAAKRLRAVLDAHKPA